MLYFVSQIITTTGFFIIQLKGGDKTTQKQKKKVRAKLVEQVSYVENNTANRAHPIYH